MRYLGSKTLLLESILNITRSYSEGGVFCDPFGGIGTVGSYMKKNGYQILSGDILYFAHCFQVALIVQNQAFSCGNLKKEYGISSGKELSEYLNRLKPKDGWLVQEYARERLFLTIENAACIQACIDCIWEWKNTHIIDEEQYNVMIASLIHCMDKVANTAGTYYAYLKHYYRKALCKFQYQLLEPIVGTEKNRALLMDAGELVRTNQCDILYLDPPYNARNYGRYYHLPQNIAMQRIPKPAGKSGMDASQSGMSDYNQKEKAVDAFKQLIANARTGCIIFHYTDKGLIDMEDAREILRKKGDLEEFYFDCKGYHTTNRSKPRPTSCNESDILKERKHMKAKLPDNDSNLALLEDFVDVEIVVTDLDGTLIDGTDSIKDNIRKKIKYLQNSYHVSFSVATGRTYIGALPVMKDLNLKDGIPVALYNGGVIMGYGTDKVFSKQVIQPYIVDELFEYLINSESSLYVYTFEISEMPFVTEEKNYTQEKVYGMGYKGKKYDSNGMPIIWVNSSRQIPERIVAILIEERQIDLPLKEAVMSYLDKNDMVEATNSGNGYIEIKGKGFNKGSIFQIFKGLKKYEEKKTLAIGDNNNDIDLFEKADISVAVVNSSKAAIDAADYICKYEKGTGFLQMLRVMASAKRFC